MAALDNEDLPQITTADLALLDRFVRERDVATVMAKFARHYASMQQALRETNDRLQANREESGRQSELTAKLIAERAQDIERGTQAQRAALESAGQDLKAVQAQVAVATEQLARVRDEATKAQTDLDRIEKQKAKLLAALNG